MRFLLVAGGLLGCALAAVPALAQTEVSAPCAIVFYPAEKLHSVGEDFDAVHKLDQDLKDYDLAAGRPLEWLATNRQSALIDGPALASTLGLPAASFSASPTALKRSQALAAGPHSAPVPACLVEVMVPQLLMERGGLSNRSLRLFGIVRRYRDGQLASSYSGFAIGALPGFKLRDPADAAAATALVEHAYTSAVGALVSQSLTHGQPIARPN